MKGNVKQEIEVKLRVADAAAMRRLLRRMGGRVIRRVHEMNTLFDTPRGTLRKRGRLMRLREETALVGGLRTLPSKEEARAARRSFASLRMTKGAPRYVLTFKRPVELDREKQMAPAGSRRYERYKVREEMEYIVGDPRAVLAVVGPAGMRSGFRYEKYRTSYRVPGAGGVHVEFDETPAGAFLELEGPRRAIDRMARRLGYRPEDYITKSYAALHWDDCRRRGVWAGDMVFRARKK